MKTGRGYEMVRAEVARQLATKRDFIAPVSKVRLIEGGEEVYLGAGDGIRRVRPVNVTVRSRAGLDEVFGVRRTAHDQLAAYTDVPRAYYQRMLASEPGLLVANVNTWLERRRDDETRMVRTVDGAVRAFVSPRFRRLDNMDLLHMLGAELEREGPDLEVVSCELTEERMYCKIRKPGLRAVIGDRRVTDTTGMRVGDVVEAALSVSNSEVGASSFRVEPMLYRLACLNGMVSSYALKKFHIGHEIKLEDDGSAREIFQTRTLQLDDQAFWAKAQDVIRAALQEDVFRAEVEKVEAATREMLPVGKRGLVPVTERLVEELGLPESLAPQVTANLANSGDLSRWGAVNAVTMIANDVEDYELATQLERAGGAVLELPKSTWLRLGAEVN